MAYKNIKYQETENQTQFRENIKSRAAEEGNWLIYDIANSLTRMSFTAESFVACASEDHIFIGNGVFDMTPEEQYFVIIHEFLHMVYKHYKRGKAVAERYSIGRQEYAHKLYNIAADIIINRRIGERLPIPESAVTEDTIGNSLVSDRQVKQIKKAKTTDEVYKILCKSSNQFSAELDKVQVIDLEIRGIQAPTQEDIDNYNKDKQKQAKKQAKKSKSSKSNNSKSQKQQNQDEQSQAQGQGSGSETEEQSQEQLKDQQTQGNGSQSNPQPEDSQDGNSQTGSGTTGDSESDEESDDETTKGGSGNGEGSDEETESYADNSNGAGGGYCHSVNIGPERPDLEDQIADYQMVYVPEEEYRAIKRGIDQVISRIEKFIGSTDTKDKVKGYSRPCRYDFKDNIIRKGDLGMKQLPKVDLYLDSSGSMSSNYKELAQSLDRLQNRLKKFKTRYYRFDTFIRPLDLKNPGYAGGCTDFRPIFAKSSEFKIIITDAQSNYEPVLEYLKNHKALVITNDEKLKNNKEVVYIEF